MTATIFQAAKLPLTVWFLALYLLSQAENGISALDPGRQLGVSPDTARLLKHKLMLVMVERDAGRKLEGEVQVDDACLGGEGALVAEGVGAEREGDVEGAGVGQVADAVVGGDALDAEQGMAVGAGLLVLYAALEGEGGGILQEEAGESAGDGGGDRELLVIAAAGIGESGGGVAEAGWHGIEDEGIESPGCIPSQEGAAAKSRAW